MHTSDSLINDCHIAENQIQHQDFTPENGDNVIAYFANNHSVSSMAGDVMPHTPQNQNDTLVYHDENQVVSSMSGHIISPTSSMQPANDIHHDLTLLDLNLDENQLVSSMPVHMMSQTSSMLPENDIRHDLTPVDLNCDENHSVSSMTGHVMPETSLMKPKHHLTHQDWKDVIAYYHDKQPISANEVLRYFEDRKPYPLIFSQGALFWHLRKTCTYHRTKKPPLRREIVNRYEVELDWRRCQRMSHLLRTRREICLWDNVS